MLLKRLEQERFNSLWRKTNAYQEQSSRSEIRLAQTPPSMVTNTNDRGPVSGSFHKQTEVSVPQENIIPTGSQNNAGIPISQPLLDPLVIDSFKLSQIVIFLFTIKL